MPRSIASLKRYPAFTDFSNVSAICSPLENIGVDMFCYHRTFKDASELMLSSHAAWLEHFYCNNYLTGAGEDFLGKESRNFKAIIWPLDNSYRILEEVRGISRIYHGVTLQFNATEEYTDLFGFGIKQDIPNGLNLLVNNMELLERFSIYFQNTVADLITKCTENKILLPQTIQKSIKGTSADLKGLAQTRRIFIKETHLKRSRMSALIDGVNFSARELDCIRYLLLGNSARGVAEKLFISFRTVESHWESIKLKLNCTKKSEVISRLLNSDDARRILAIGMEQM